MKLTCIKRTWRGICMIAACFIASSPLLAHHGTAAMDMSKMLTSRATVTKFVWSNPHIEIRFTTPGQGGNAEEWNVEGDPINMMAETGWNKNALKVGDIISIDYYGAKNGSKIGYAVKVVTPDGKCLPRSVAWTQLCSK